MAELVLNRDETPGIMKELDDGAMELIFQAIQEDIYSFPIKSFVREAISNGLDAIVERDIFYKIKDGEPIEKYYRQKQDGKLLKDSEFNSEYYNEEFLSNDPKVTVDYVIPTEGRRHKIKIKDFGVGLGGSRLRGFFKIGYSSKRNLKAVFGKFGSGAKAGLATGVDYFIMTTNYNGYTTSFMIFKTDYEAITPKSDNTISESWNIKMMNGDISKRDVHWTPTEEPNGVTIELEVKPHNQKAFREAVINQFQHFNGKVLFKYMLFKDGSTHIDKLDVTPLYESDTLLIPAHSSYYSPTILIDGISYGPISWNELELEHRTGTVAIKTTATEVDITQSRESIKYTERTKNVVLRAIERAEEEATDYLTSRLTSTRPDDLFGLLENYKLLDKEEDNITKTFAKFLNMAHLKPKYEFNPKWFNGKELTSAITPDLFEALFYNYNIKLVQIYFRSGKAVIKTKDISSFSDLTGAKIIYAVESSLGPKTAHHILEKFEVDTFIYIRPNSKDRNITTLKEKEFNPVLFKNYTKELILRRCDIYLDEYTYKEAFTGELGGAEVELNTLSLAQLRRKNQEILYRFRDEYNMLRSETIKQSELKDHLEDIGQLVICTHQYRDWGDFIHTVQEEIDSNVMVIYVAKDVIREFLPYGTFITDYIRNYNPKTKELTLCPEFKFYITSIKKEKIEAKFRSTTERGLRNEFVEAFNPVIADGLYKYSSTYDMIHGLTTRTRRTLDNFVTDITLIDNLIKEKSPVKTIKMTGLTCFNADVRTLDAYNTEFIHGLNEVSETLIQQKDIIALLDPDYLDTITARNTLYTLINNLNSQEQ